MRLRILILAGVLSLQVSGQALAGLQTFSSRSNSVTSGTWSVVTTVNGQPITNSPYTVQWSVSTGVAYNFFAFRNIGSLTINAFLVEITQTQFGGSGKPNDTAFELCSGGTWNSATNTCSGTVTLVGKASNLYLSFGGLNLVPGSELSMRASTATNVKNSYTTSLSVSVNRYQVRNSQVLNS